MNAPLFEPGCSPDLGIRPGKEPLTLAWACERERQLAMNLAAIEGLHTVNLRTIPGARIVVLRRPQGGLAGWAGVDADSDPKRPEAFAHYVYPEYRGRGLRALLEHVGWAYLDQRGCATAYMRMELDHHHENLFRRRRMSGPCRHCEQSGTSCRRQAILTVDVQRALAASTRERGPLDLEALPFQVL
jgi:GNAT superfamily N-acetyltransferase